MNIKQCIKGLSIVVAMVFLTNCAQTRHAMEDKMHHSSIALNMALKENIPSTQVATHVGYGIIQAAGFVNDEEQLRLVSNVLEQHKGEYRLINNVKILKAKDEAKDEKALEKAVYLHLKEKKFPIKDVDVKVRNGHVLLSGFMNKHVDLDDMTAKVHQLPGVHDVNNYILYKHSLTA